MTQQPRPVRRTAAAAAPANSAGRPARAATAAAPSNDPLYYEAKLTSPSIQTFKGTIKSVGEHVVQMFVHQRGGQVRLQDFPAEMVLAMVQGAEPNSDLLYCEASTGPTFGKLVLTGYESNFTVFQDQKGQVVKIRSGKSLVQSDKRQPDVMGVSTGSRSNAGTGAGRGRRSQ